MDPVSIIAFVGFSVQVVGVIQQVLSFLSGIQDAPSSVQRLTRELQTLEDIILASSQDEKRFEHASKGACQAYQKALDAVNEQCRALLELLEDALPEKGARRRKRVWRAVNFVFKEEKFAKLVEGLERGKSSLQLAQLCISNEASAYSNRLLMETNSHLFKLTQAIIQSGQRSNVSDTAIDTWKFFSLGEAKTTAHDIVEVDDSCEAELEAINHASESGAFAQESNEREQSVELQNDPSILASATSELSLTRQSASQFLSDKKHEHVNVLQSRTDITMFHNRVLGTVLVSRRKAVGKKWNEEDQRYEKESQSIQTIIRVRPTPWLLSKGFEIKVEELMRRYGSSNLNISLNVSRYVPIWQHFHHNVFKQGDLTGLQHVLEKGTISIQDRDQFSQRNLLELSMSSLTADWFFAEMYPEEVGRKRKEIVRMSRWLVSQGLTYDFNTDPRFFDDWFFLCPEQDVPKNEMAAEMYELECLLLEGTDNAPCLPRAAALILFIIVNEIHSRQLHCTIQDLFTEAAVDQRADYFAEKERIYWANVEKSPSDLISGGMENVIAGSMLQLAISTKGDKVSSRRNALKGSRRILCRSFNIVGNKAVKVNGSITGTRDDDVAFFTRMLVLCRNMDILDDGFGDHFTDLACAHQCLDVWIEGLHAAGYDPKPFLSSHSQASEPEEQSLKLRLGGIGVFEEFRGYYENGVCKRHAHDPARLEDDFFDTLRRTSDFYTESEEIEEPILIAELPRIEGLRERVTAVGGESLSDNV